MIHFFDTDIAKKYGIQCAILLQNIAYWVHHNEANERNFRDGKYWVYNSKRAWSKIYDYMSEDQVKRTLDKLKEYGLLETGNYNSSSLDRTLWYTITPKALKELRESTFSDWAKSPNALDEIARPIPNNIHTNINSSSCAEKPSVSSSQTAFDLILDNGDLYNVPQELIDDYRKAYPNVDVEASLRRMNSWLISNPSKRKTRKGIKRFMNSWLNRESTSNKSAFSDNVSPDPTYDYSDYVL